MTNRPIGDYGLETDFYWSYGPQAKEFLNGNLIIDQNRGPVYQIVLAGFALIFGKDFFMAGKFLNVLFASVTLFFISKIISSIFNMKAALWVVLFVVVNNFFLKFSYEPGTDMLFLVFYTSAIFYILKNKNLDHRNFLIAGVLSGIAYLTRYTAISLFLSVMIILLITIHKNYKSDVRLTIGRICKPFLFYFAPVIVMIVAWGMVCLQKTGKFFYNMNYLNTAFAVYKSEDTPPDEWTSKYQDSFTSYYDVIFRDFGTFMYKIFIVNFTTYFVNDLSALMPLYIGLFVALGLVLFIIKIKTHNLRQRYFFLFSLIFYIQILFAFYSERFSLPLIPFYCFLIVKVFSYDFLQKYNISMGKVKLFTLLALSLIIMNFSYSYGYVKEKINLVPVEIISLTDLIKSEYKEELTGKVIMARKPHVAFYLDMNFEVIPFSKTYEEFYDNIKKKNADYVYISEWEARILHPDLAKVVINYKKPPPGLEVVAFSEDPVGILYKVKK